MDSTERISKLQNTIEELRKTYLNIKGDLNAIERRRKKIRRKERERTQQTTEAAAWRLFFVYKGEQANFQQ